MQRWFQPVEFHASARALLGLCGLFLIIGVDLKDKNLYWDNFYAQNMENSIFLPSQFAVFIASEYGKFDNILELGCGSGRDSIFFIDQGFNVYAGDSSLSAIQACRNKLNKMHRQSIECEFSVVDFSSVKWFDQLVGGKDLDGSLLVYARFLLHAVEDSVEDNILDTLSSKLPLGSILAVEFRTMKDAFLEKVTDAHYRRYINPLVLINKSIKLGFAIDYFVEGFGFAKWKADDAHVARCIFRKE